MKQLEIAARELKDDRTDHSATSDSYEVRRTYSNRDNQSSKYSLRKINTNSCECKVE